MKLAYSDNQVFEYKESELKTIDMSKFKLSKKQLLNVKSLIMYNKKTKEVVFETSAVYPQHFYPLSIYDYAIAIKEMLKKDIEELPILSVSSKDYPYCDFKCKDCLADPSRKWAIDNLKEPEIELEKYKKILKSISDYSKSKGVDSVRFEFCGEGNPDLYKYRSEIIEYAAKECNMGVVYISTGSKMNDKLKNTLAKYAAYIRISLPGITNESYDYYSEQKSINKFTFDSSMKLLNELVHLRKKNKREDELLIGVRTCMRKKNNGHYLELADRLGKMGIDSFQIVKVLTDNQEIVLKNYLDDETRKEVKTIEKNYKKYGLIHLQVPDILDKLYLDRTFHKLKKPSKCFSSMVSPILYASNLITCIHWDKIKDKQFHYGKLDGSENEVYNLIYGERGQTIRNSIPQQCSNCCALNDNLMLEAIRTQLSLYNELDDIEFFLVVGDEDEV